MYVINVDEFKSIGTHWIALYVNGNKVIYFDSKRNYKIHRKEKYNTSIRIHNVWILLYQIR